MRDLLTRNAEMVCILANRGYELNGQTSYGTYTAIVEYAWFIDGGTEPDYYGETLSTDLLSPGTHTVYLRVSDGYGHEAQTSITTTISE